jgi:hypothetical protein
MTEFRGFIRETVPVRSIDGIPIVCRNLARQFIINMDRSGSVRLEGRQNDLNNFIVHSDFLGVDCSGINEPGEYTLPVTAVLPAGLALIRQDPTELPVTVTLREEQ